MAFGTDQTVNKQLEENLLTIIKGWHHYHLDIPDYNHYPDYQDYHYFHNHLFNYSYSVRKQLEENLLKIINGRDHYHLVTTPASFFGLIDQCWSWRGDGI